MTAPRPSKTSIGNHVLHPETLMLNYGYDPELSEGAVKPPVFLTSTFVFKTAEDGRDFSISFPGVKSRQQVLVRVLSIRASIIPTVRSWKIVLPFMKGQRVVRCFPPACRQLPRLCLLLCGPAM